MKIRATCKALMSTYDMDCLSKALLIFPRMEGTCHLITQTLEYQVQKL